MQARQPMVSHSGSTVIAWNGEVWNTAELRSALEDPAPVPWRSGSDTEVLLEACERWGVEYALRRVSGMFALAVYRVRDERLVLARDRFGIKPLCWTAAGSVVAFASDPRAFRALPFWDSALNTAATCEFLATGYVGAPRSAFRDVRHLEPGVLLEWGPASTEPVRRVIWWSFAHCVLDGVSRSLTRDPRESAEVFIHSLQRIVPEHLVGVRQMGALLSGGRDSAVVAAVAAAAGHPVDTFTVGFPGTECDESATAHAHAALIGVPNHLSVITQRDAVRFASALPSVDGEPFADQSVLPMLLIAERAAARGVVVLLTGDGADELLGGYTRRHLHARVHRLLRACSSFLPASPFCAPCLDGTLSLLLSLIPGPVAFRHRLGTLALSLRPGLSQSFPQSYRSIIGGADPSLVGHFRFAPFSPLDGLIESRVSLSDLMLYLDTVAFLPRVLQKVDRSLMWYGIEGRPVFLDHRLVELVWRLPALRASAGRRSKWVLDMIFTRSAAGSCFRGPKRGFGVPMASWLAGRGPFRDWLLDLLSSPTLSTIDGVDASAVRRSVDAIASRRFLDPEVLWRLATLIQWRQAQSG